MKVLVDQQFHLGHHYHYIAHLLPGLIGRGDDVVVAVTQEGLESVEFNNLLARFSDAVRFEPILPYASPSIPMGERAKVHRDLRDLVKTARPDYVLIPSGDAQTTAMAWWHCTGRGAVPGHVPCEVGIHLGSGRAASTPAKRLRDVANRLNLGLSGARRVHLMNLLFYEATQRGPFASRFSLMPHPVSANPRHAAAESRRRLGIPEEGRYMGIAGSIDMRKAIGELLRAFRDAALGPRDRILLAGWIHPTHVRLIDDHFADLLHSERLILLNRFLTTDEYAAALTALDVVATPYPAFNGVSSTLLEAVSAGRPVLAHDTGWMQVMVSRFGLGWTCDVLSPESLKRSVGHAFEHASQHRETDAIRRLLAFHEPENFAAAWTNGLRPEGNQLRTWAWVEEAIAPER